jgi:ABC-2 type transport system permease protein
MNVFFRELKSHRKSILFWCLGMVFLVYSGMVKYANLKSTGQSIEGLMDQFPKAVKVIFGINGFDLSTVSGYFGVLFLYIALAATLHALLLGTEIISKEERDKTTEFLFVKPLSRLKVLLQKLWAALVCVTIVNLVTTVTSIYMVDYFNSGTSVTGIIIALMVGLYCLQLIFLSTGMAVAASTSSAKKASSIATAILLSTFILPFLTTVNDRLNFLKILSPFEYFDAKTIIDSAKVNLAYVVLSSAIILILVSLFFVLYKKRDLRV